ncbi:MAG TPA: hypothetical protein VFO06_11040 [Gemmatimonadales bacterium]|nr:hypothetical protein [Gemmatimonadales bacterium]
MRDAARSLTSHYDLPRPRRRADGLIVSLLLHALVIALIIWGPLKHMVRIPPPGTPGLLTGGGGGGGGGAREVRYISVPASQPPSATPPAIPPVVPPVAAEVPSPPVEAVARADSAPVTAAPAGGLAPGVGPGAGGGTGGGIGGGVGPGTGAGVGPGTGGGGEGGPAGRAPEWTYGTFVLDGGTPKELRGAELRVTWYLLETGRIARMEVDPPIKDRDFAKRFLERAESFRFRPARAPDGTPVAGVITMTFILGTK